jgi:hypothetical protein
VDFPASGEPVRGSWKWCVTTPYTASSNNQPHPLRRECTALSGAQWCTCTKSPGARSPSALKSLRQHRCDLHCWDFWCLRVCSADMTHLTDTIYMGGPQLLDGEPDFLGQAVPDDVAQAIAAGGCSRLAGKFSGKACATAYPTCHKGVQETWTPTPSDHLTAVTWDQPPRHWPPMMPLAAQSSRGQPQPQYALPCARGKREPVGVAYKVEANCRRAQQPMVVTRSAITRVFSCRK